MLKILITGDLVLKQSSKECFIDSNLAKLFSQSHLNIINLEAPITKSTLKTLKTGINLKGDKKNTAYILKTLNTHAVTLANNHIMDFGEEGLMDTLKFCQENHIKTVGAGANLDEASQTIYIDSSEGKIAIVNFAENEFTAATETSAGFHPMDVIDNAYKIQEARKNADYVIVIIHGGHEHYKLPSPRMQKQYRFYAEQGADIIVGHHTHCINGNEVWKGTPIYYSLGNFLFPKVYPKDYEWNTGLILDIEIANQQLKSQIHPIGFYEENSRLTLLENEQKNEILNEIEELNQIIVESEKLNNAWNDFLNSKYTSYLQFWSPLSFFKNRFVKYILRKTNYNYTNKKGLTLFLNLIRCESHSDVSKAILRNYIKKSN